MLALCMASSACAVPAAVQPCWKLDFASGRPHMNWWSIDRTNNTCSLDYVTDAATGGQALQFDWNSKGTWLLLCQSPLAEPIPPFDRMLVRVKLSSEVPLPDIRECCVRVTDADAERFTISDGRSQKRIWRASGERELSILVDEKAIAHAKVYRPSTNTNGRIDFPLKDLGLYFRFPDEGAAPMRITFKEISCTPLPKVEVAALPEFGLFKPLYDAAELPMLMPRSGVSVDRVRDAATGCTAIELSGRRMQQDFGFEFCLYGGAQGALAPKLPVCESGELVMDVVNSHPIDRMELRVVDMYRKVPALAVDTPELAVPGRHTIVAALPKDFESFALSGIGFHTIQPASGTVARVTRTSMRYRARPADTLALELDTGTLPRVVTPEAASRGVKVGVCNITDRAQSFDVTLRLADFRGDDAGWKITERMSFAPGETKTFTCPVPDRFGVYYMEMSVCPPGGETQDVAERRRSFAHFKPTGATPEVKDAPGFCFGSVCHLNPYFGNEAEIVRMADAMAQIGLKIVRTNFKPYSAFAYTWYDKMVDIFSARGINFDFILDACTFPDGSPDIEKSLALYRPGFARYKGRVKYWELLNEPDHSWKPNMPITAAGYAELARCTSAELRRIDPAAQFMSAGFCCFESKTQGHFQHDAMAACWRVFDLHCFHGHHRYLEFRSVIDDKLLSLRREAGVEIPWYANETALTTANGIGDRVQAEALVKKLLFAWSRGARGYIWYNLRGKGENMMDNEQGYGMLTMRLDPKAVYCAWNALTGICRNKEFRREISCGDGNRCFLLGSAEGEVAGLWREKPGSRRIALRTAAATAETADIFGNRAPCAVADGRIELDISTEPVWLILPPDSGLTSN